MMQLLSSGQSCNRNAVPTIGRGAGSREEWIHWQRRATAAGLNLATATLQVV